MKSITNIYQLGEIVIAAINGSLQHDVLFYACN